MADRIRIIPDAPEGIPDTGSFEVWFVDGRPSEFFYLREAISTTASR
jgi:hypothetical protein